MEKCEMLKCGEAYKVYPQTEMRRNLSEDGKYVIGKELVLCPIKKGKCPYGKEAIDGEEKTLRMFDETGINKSICTSNGLIKKAGLLDLEIVSEKNNIIQLREHPEFKVDTATSLRKRSF